MDQSALLEIFKVGGPSLVYLAGLIFALRKIAELYESRLGEQGRAYERNIETLKDGYDAKIRLLSESITELQDDRKVLRGELDRLRERLISEIEDHPSSPTLAPGG